MDDLISRQAVIDAFDTLCDRECEYSKQQRSFMCGACRLGSAFDVIDVLPSAQPEHGRWEQIVHPWYKCSECGEQTAAVNLNGKVIWNYCPYCGASMDEVEE